MKKGQREMIEYLVTKLNEDGIVSDENNSVRISSSTLKKWSEECTERLRQNGYCGGELLCIGKHSRVHGPIYALYDIENLPYEEAMAYLESLGGWDSENIE